MKKGQNKILSIIFIGIALLIVVLLTFIAIKLTYPSSTLTGQATKTTCQTGYIRIGDNDCCKDKNSNNLCDDSEILNYLDNPEQLKRLEKELGMDLSNLYEEEKKEYELECKYNCVEIVDGERHTLIEIVNQEYNPATNSISFEIQNFHQCERRCSIDNGKDASKVIFIEPLGIYEGELKIYDLKRAGITCLEGLEPSGRDCMPDEKQVFFIKEK